MKTFTQFRKEAQFAKENLMLESKGFKDVANKRRKKKQEYLSPRQAKIKKLRNSDQHWSGLENVDLFS